MLSRATTCGSQVDRVEAPVRVFKAEPVRTMSFAPGRQQVVLKARLAEPAEVLRVNSAGKAPAERRLSENVRFVEAMRAKGWLRR
jgi:hypothetical protein